MTVFYNNGWKILYSLLVVGLFVSGLMLALPFFQFLLAIELLLLSYIFYMLLHKPKVTFSEQGILITYLFAKNKFIQWQQIAWFNIETESGGEGFEITELTIHLIGPKEETHRITIFLNEFFGQENQYKKIVLKNDLLRKKDLYHIHEILVTRYPSDYNFDE